MTKHQGAERVRAAVMADQIEQAATAIDEAALTAATAAVREMMSDNFLELHSPDEGSYDRLAREFTCAVLAAIPKIGALAKQI